MNGLPSMHEAQRFDRSTKQRKLNKFFDISVYLLIFCNCRIVYMIQCVIFTLIIDLSVHPGYEMAQYIKCLLRKHGNLSLDL